MKLKISDFAEKYQIARQSAYRLIKEGNLIPDKDKLIDENLTTNKAWIESRQAHLQEQGTQEQESTEAPDTLTSLKRLNLRLDAEFKELRNQEKAGKLVPTDAVKAAVVQLITQYKMTFLQQVDLLVRDTLNENLISNEIIVKTCSQLIDISNQSTHSACENLEKNIESIIEQSTGK